MNSGFDDEVSTTDNFNNSAHPHLRDDIEWSIDVEAEVGVHSLDLISCLGVKIDNSPSLVKTVVSLPYNNLLTFFIFALPDIKNLLVLNIDQVLASVSEQLEPSGVGVPHLHVVGSSSTPDIK